MRTHRLGERSVAALAMPNARERSEPLKHHRVEVEPMVDIHEGDRDRNVNSTACFNLLLGTLKAFAQNGVRDFGADAAVDPGHGGFARGCPSLWS
eukprot:5228933-Amphidinium_carterae.1